MDAMKERRFIGFFDERKRALAVLFDEAFFEPFIFAISDDAALMGVFEIRQLLANADFFGVGDFCITAAVGECCGSGG
jgi:hypothetical protein